MKSEAAAAAGGPAPVACHGPGPARAAAAAWALVGAGATALVSFGVAAGLAPALRPGDVVLATAIVTAGGDRLPCDAALSAALRSAVETIAAMSAGDLLGSETVIADAAAKHALHATTGALAADMESHAVARVAAAAGLPFAACRVILDAAGRAVPPAALAGMAPDGGVRPLRVVAALVARPQDLPGLVALGRAERAAMRLLRAIGPRLAAAAP